jgi:alpha-beta hydrolase superfamily lysophospholipase
LRANPANAPLLEDAEAAIATLETGERVDVTPLHPALQSLFAPAVQGFLIDLMAQDPAALAKQTDLPMLIVHGGNDLQVTATDAQMLRVASPQAKYLEIPAMNHVLKDIPDGAPAANRASYGDPSLPVSRALVAGVADFVTRDRGASE